MTTKTLTLPILVDSPELHRQVLRRVRRWSVATDRRIVEQLWPRQPGGAGRPLCPGCGVILRDGMLITLNQMADYFPAGPAQVALASGDVEALTPELPIEPGELWCVVCLPCVEDHRQTPSEPWLSERLLGLVNEVLVSN